MAPDSRQTSSQSSKLADWMAAVPIPSIDRYLLLTQWAMISILSVILLDLESHRILYPESWRAGLVNAAVALPFFLGCKLVLSFFAWRTRPLATGQAGWLLVNDLLVAATFYALTGGIGSVYFFLFPLVGIEAAMVLKRKAAVLFILGLTALHIMIVVVIAPPSSWNATVVAVASAESTVIVVLSALVLFFTEQIRREEAARQTTVVLAERTAALHEIALQLAEHSLDRAHVIETVLAGAASLSETKSVLIVLPDESGANWRVAASNSVRHPVDEQAPVAEWVNGDKSLSGAGAGYPAPLPEFVASDGIKQLITLRMYLPGGAVLGAVLLGRISDRPLADHEREFLEELALETGWALRDMQVYLREQEQNERLQRFQETQSVFFSTMAHEMKTPLTVLKTLMPSVQRLPELPDDTRAEMMEVLEDNLTRLERLITSLLQSSRLQANAIALHTRPLNLARHTQRVLDGLAALFARKRQHVQLQSSTDLPLVLADSGQIEHLLINLLENASKFAPSDSVIVVEICAYGEIMQLCVEDAGPGIPRAERERVFEKFYTANHGQVSTGVGLGLFICRELVHLHGGRIWVEDRQGGGCRICFTLPLAEEPVAHEENRP